MRRTLQFVQKSIWWVGLVVDQILDLHGSLVMFELTSCWFEWPA